MSAPGSRRKEYDRSITDGPLGPAVWKLAWPTVVTNVIGGLQGVIDHAMVGNYVGFTGNAAIGVSWQIFLIVIVFISSLFSGMSVLVARFAGAGDHDKVDRTVYQAFLTAIFTSLGVLAPIGYFGAPVLLGLVNASPAVQAEALLASAFARLQQPTKKLAAFRTASGRQVALALERNTQTSREGWAKRFRDIKTRHKTPKAG